MTAPEVTARPAAETEMPRGARSIVKKAAANGWASRATYARGTDIGKKTLPVVDSVVVQLAKAPLRAFGIWHDGKFVAAYAWADGINPRSRGSRELSKLLEVA